MNAARLLAWLVLPLVALVLVSMVAVWAVHAFLGIVWYLLIGAALVAGGMYVVGKVRRALAPGTRAQRRLEAAAETYRMRNR